jgi:hypothetical protein
MVMARHPGPAFGRPEHMLVPAISLVQAPYCRPKRDHRDEPGDDEWDAWVSIWMTSI